MKIGHDPNNSDKIEAAKKENPARQAKIIDFQPYLARKRNQHPRTHKQNPSFSPEASELANTSFMALHLFPSRLEAEMVGEILKQSGIPFLIRSDDIGIFGPGMLPVPGGAILAIRKHDFEEALSLLSGLI